MTATRQLDIATDPSAPIVALLNSRPHAIYRDRLDDGAYVAALVRSLGAAADAVTAEGIEEMRSLRDALLVVLDAAAPSAVAAGWGRVSGFARDVALRVRFADDGVPVLEGISKKELSALMVVQLTRVLESGNWSRIKPCANDQCQSVFVDDTKNRSQRWHSYETCGNKINVAAHRARRTEADSAV